MGRLFLIIAAVLGVVCLAVPAAAGAPAARCQVSGNTALSFAEVRRSQAWDCTPTVSESNASYVWVRFAAAALDPAADRLTGTPVPYAAMHIVTEARDGTITQRTVGPDAVAEHWRIGTSFALPLGARASDLRAVYVGVEGALNPGFVNVLAVEREGETTRGSAGMVALVGIFIGMLLVTALASGMVAVALRRSFGYYHLAFTLFLTLYALSSSSLIYLLVPGMGLWARTILSYSSLGLAVAMVGPLVLDFFERHSLPRAVRTAIRWSVACALLAAAMMPLNYLTGWPLRYLYNLAFIPGAASLIVALVVALRRGSRSARMFAAAWAMPLVFAIERIARGMDLYVLPPVADFMFYGAMAIEALVMTAGIIWRFNELRDERDRAVARGAVLEAAALEDALTGLPNRRDFLGHQLPAGQFLAILDLDHFKSVNDTLGHEGGDRVLMAAANALRAAVAEGRLAGAWRFGGEEFVILARGPESDAIRAVEALRRGIVAAVASAGTGLTRAQTASAGMAEIAAEGREGALRQADKALYAAKQAGRDLVFVFDAHDGQARAVAIGPNCPS